MFFDVLCIKYIFIIFLYIFIFFYLYSFRSDLNIFNIHPTLLGMLSCRRLWEFAASRPEPTLVLEATAKEVTSHPAINHSS